MGKNRPKKNHVLRGDIFEVGICRYVFFWQIDVWEKIINIHTHTYFSLSHQNTQLFFISRSFYRRKSGNEEFKQETLAAITRSGSVRNPHPRYKVGPLLVINGLITLISRVITSVTYLCSAIYRDYFTPFIPGFHPLPLNTPPLRTLQSVYTHTHTQCQPPKEIRPY